MAMVLNGSGPKKIVASRDKEGYREFKVTRIVEALLTEGPLAVMYATGLPAIGDYYLFKNEWDIWAFCTPEMEIAPLKSDQDGPITLFAVTQTFSTKPSTHRCQDNDIEDPLLEPYKISGSFTKTTKEQTRDKDGKLIRYSSFEQIRGDSVKFDSDCPTVSIEMNTADLGLSTFAAMINTVNSSPLWGLDARCIKLSNVPWSRQMYGTCSFYYTRTFEFEINYNTFDRTLLDFSSKCIRGHWDTKEDSETKGQYIADEDADPDNPNDFIQFLDVHQHPSRCLLDKDGSGKPVTTEEDAGTVEVKYYSESDFLSLGIPTSF